MKELTNIFVVFDTRTGERIEYCVKEVQAKKRCKDNEELDYYAESVLREIEREE